MSGRGGSRVDQGMDERYITDGELPQQDSDEEEWWYEDGEILSESEQDEDSEPAADEEEIVQVVMEGMEQRKIY